MGTEPSSKKMRIQSLNSDRISNLPEDLMNKILSLIPIRDVVKTAAVSRFWRYRWMFVRHLVFDRRSVPTPPWTSAEGLGLLNKKLADFINHVLLLHNGNLNVFGVTNYMVCSCNDVDQWLLLLARKSVKEVILEIPLGDPYKVPSSLFSYQLLTVLKLQNAILNMPSLEKGFPKLIVLHLCEVTFSNATISSLVFNSRIQKLTLIQCTGFNRLNICAPYLTSFILRGPCERVQFPNSPNLKYAYIGLQRIVNASTGAMVVATYRSELILVGLLSVSTLSLSKRFMEILTAIIASEKRQPTFYNLSSLSLVMNLAKAKQILTALYLFRSSPHLQALYLSGCSTNPLVKLTEDQLWHAQLQQNEVIFPRLKTVEFSRFKGNWDEFEIIKFVLSTAKTLKKMTIIWDASIQVGTHRARILETMMRFPRVSPSAMVTFLG